jgi:uncharacterized protein (DUF1499 family)
MRRLFVTLLIALLIAAVAAAALLLTPLGDRPLAALFPAGAAEPVDFATLPPPDRPNRYLVCPPGLCRATPDAESAVFDVPVDRLRERWREVVGAQPRVVRLGAGDDGLQHDYVQRSAHFRFPDIVTVRFVALAPSRSSLAVYSRSVFGRDDFGVNRERVEAWIGALRAIEQARPRQRRAAGFSVRPVRATVCRQAKGRNATWPGSRCLTNTTGGSSRGRSSGTTGCRAGVRRSSCNPTGSASARIRRTWRRRRRARTT